MRSQDSVISEDDLNNKLDKEGYQIQGLVYNVLISITSLYRRIWKVEKTKALVDVRILPTDWIFRVTDNADENDLFMLINILHKQPSDALFSTEFVEVLIEEFWERYQFSIFITVFIPFIIYALATVVYFTLHAARMQ